MGKPLCNKGRQKKMGDGGDIKLEMNEMGFGG